MWICQRNLFRYLLFGLLLIVAGCSANSPTQEEKAISLVQQSSAAYGRVVDVLQQLGADETVQRMPSYKEAANRLFEHPTWNAFQGEDGKLYVHFEGGTSLVGNYTEYVIQWVIRGDLDAGTAQPYLYSFVVDGVPKSVGMFDALSVMMLYDLQVINEEQLVVLGIAMAINNFLF